MNSSVSIFRFFLKVFVCIFFRYKKLLNLCLYKTEILNILLCQYFRCWKKILSEINLGDLLVHLKRKYVSIKHFFYNVASMISMIECEGFVNSDTYISLKFLVFCLKINLVVLKDRVKECLENVQEKNHFFRKTIDSFFYSY